MKSVPQRTHPRFFEFVNSFRIAATSRNFLEASQKLQISQANLSLQLRQLEELLPQFLFELKGKKKVLTHFGVEFLAIAEKSLEEAESSLSDFCQSHEKEESLTLKIGCRPDQVSSLQKKIHFKGTLEFTSLSSEDVATAIQDKKIHLGITYLPPDSLDVVAVKAFKSGRVFITHPSDRFSNPVKLPHGWFAGRMAVAFENGHLLSDFFSAAGIRHSEVRKICVVDSWRAVIDLVKSNSNTYAVVPEYMRAHLGELHAQTLPYEKYKPVDFYYVFLKSLKKIPAYANVIKKIQE